MMWGALRGKKDGENAEGIAEEVQRDPKGAKKAESKKQEAKGQASVSY